MSRLTDWSKTRRTLGCYPRLFLLASKCTMMPDRWLIELGKNCMHWPAGSKAILSIQCNTSVVAAHQLRPVGERQTARDLTAGRSLAPVPGRPFTPLGPEPRCWRCRSSSVSLGASSIRLRGPASVMLRLLSTSMTPSSALFLEICSNQGLLQMHICGYLEKWADAACLQVQL